MMAELYVLIFLYLSCLYVTHADLLKPLRNDTKNPNCEPNKIYKAENMTCICTEKGEWSNDRCYLYFQRLNSYEQTCEPDQFVIIDCNVCRCDRNGKVNEDQCTKHECGAVEKSRRSFSIEGSCEPNRWYSYASCRLCFCVNKHKLICNNENISSKIHVGNYDLSECSENLLLDMKKLTSDKKALRVDNDGQIVENNIDDHSSIGSLENTQEIEEESAITHNLLKANNYGGKSKEENDVPSVKRKVKKSDNQNNSLNKNQSHVLRIKLPNVFDDILNLVLRKSLSINSDSKCKPETNMQVGCNNCFCLTNGKLLCTEKQCK